MTATTFAQRVAARAERRYGRPTVPADITPADLAALFVYDGRGATTEQSHQHDEDAPCDCPTPPDGLRVLLLDVHDTDGQPRQFVIEISVREAS